MSSDPWEETGNHRHWYRLKATNPEFYPQRGTIHHKKNVFRILYGKDGRAFLEPKLTPLPQFIETNLSGQKLSVVRYIPPHIETPDRMKKAWELLKKHYAENESHLTRDLMRDFHETRLWFLTDKEFFKAHVQVDPAYRKINQSLKEFHFNAAF